jgi:hypothetical protein
MTRWRSLPNFFGVGAIQLSGDRGLHVYRYRKDADHHWRFSAALTNPSMPGYGDRRLKAAAASDKDWLLRRCRFHGPVAVTAKADLHDPAEPAIWDR